MNPRDALDEILELIRKYGKWTCNEHKTCYTCPYYNNPCKLGYKLPKKEEKEK